LLSNLKHLDEIRYSRYDNPLAGMIHVHNYTVYIRLSGLGLFPERLLELSLCTARLGHSTSLFQPHIIQFHDLSRWYSRICPVSLPRVCGGAASRPHVPDLTTLTSAGAWRAEGNSPRLHFHTRSLACKPRRISCSVGRFPGEQGKRNMEPRSAATLLTDAIQPFLLGNNLQSSGMNLVQC
jgi:hypothetical protein